LNSTLKSLLFWVVLFVVGVLIWNFSTKFQSHERTASFSEFISWVDSGTVAGVTITGQDITGFDKSGNRFHTYAPTQYEGLANRLIERVRNDLHSDRMNDGINIHCQHSWSCRRTVRKRQTADENQQAYYQR